MSSKQISTDFDESQLQQIAADIIKQAQALGATASEAGVSVSVGFDVGVRLGEAETVEFNRDTALGLSVYFGQKKGSASSSDISPEAITQAVEKACHIARFTNEDPAAGIAEKTLMAYDYPDLSLYHPWSLDTEQGIALAIDCEAQALAADKRIVNSDGVSASTHRSYSVFANSHGFVGAYPSSRHNISCVLVAEEAGEMQRDYSFTVARSPDDLHSVKWVANDAARRTLRRLGARQIKTCNVPVIYAADVASCLFNRLLGAIRGSSIYRESSFLLDHLNKPIFRDFMTITEQPHLIKGLRSAPFDAEGVRTQTQSIISDGILQTYLLSSYSARKLGLRSTGNAGGVHNLIVETGDTSLEGLLKEMDTGFLVTELIGQGVNIVTGDYSRGAAGFWVENGEIQFPVHEVTIAGNLKDIFMNIVKVGNDVDRRGNIQTGSLLIENMTIAGG